MADLGTHSTYRPSFTEVIPYSRTTEAERKLLADCKIGAGVELGNKVPETATDKTRIRAALIRYLVARDVHLTL